MPSYASQFEALATRAVTQASVDAKTFVRMRIAAGTDPDAIADDLVDDLLNDGPILGKFIRGLTGASEASIMTAVRQGETVGMIDASATLQRLVALSGDARADMIERARRGDPVAAEDMERIVEKEAQLTSVAELVNTCHRCLPLHGKTMTLAQWKSAGLMPEVRHAGWTSSCKCRLVPADLLEPAEELMAPLTRNKLRGERGAKGSKRTARAVTDEDMQRAIAAARAASQTPQGRRTLRLMGRAVQQAITSIAREG